MSPSETGSGSVPWKPLFLGAGLSVVAAIAARLLLRRTPDQREEGRPPGVVEEWGKESFPASDPPQSW